MAQGASTLLPRERGGGGLACRQGGVCTLGESGRVAQNLVQAGSSCCCQRVLPAPQVAQVWHTRQEPPLAERAGMLSEPMIGCRLLLAPLLDGC